MRSMPCKSCGKQATLWDTMYHKQTNEVEETYRCSDGHEAKVRKRGPEPADELDSLERLNRFLDGLKMGEDRQAPACCDHWFLKRVLKRLVRQFHDQVYMGHFIEKAHLYQCLSWWHRLSRKDTHEVLTMLVRAYDGIELTCRGLWIPKSYLDAFRESKGGESPGGEAP